MGPSYNFCLITTHTAKKANSIKEATIYPSTCNTALIPTLTNKAMSNTTSVFVNFSIFTLPTRPKFVIIIYPSLSLILCHIMIIVHL